MKLRKSLAVLVVIVVMGLSGCIDTTSSQRIAALNSAITTAQQISTSYDTQVEQINASMPGLESAISDANLPADMQIKASETLILLKSKLATIQAEKVKVDTAIANYQEAIKNIDVNSPTLATELQIYGTGIQQIAPMTGPYAGWVYLIGLGFTTIGSIGVAMKKSNDEKTKQKQLDQVVTANQIFMDTNPTAAQAFKETQSQLQTKDTVAAVAAIKES
ncbi:MAG TPA: hypothetical protein PLP05_00415 [Sedimentisphaerales bacterium]|nr:hypothetical protein [Sedimentisphaerales bacterium]